MDFLHRLAATALGESGSLRAALPSRYAPAPVEAAEVELPAPSRPSPATTRVAEPATAAAAVVQPITAGESLRGASEPARSDAREWMPQPTVTRETAAPAAPHHASQPYVATEMAMHERRSMPMTATPTTPSRVERSPREVVSSLEEAPARMPRRELVARAAPLDAALVALHAERRSPDAPPPVIHVTIDRIDVRAPAQAPPRGDKTAAARPAPARSLADYLRGRSK